MSAKSKRIKCPDCGHTYRSAENHQKAKCQLIQATRRTVDRLDNNREQRRVLIDGYFFDSAHESELYLYLKNELQSGRIKDLKCQDVLYLSNARFMMKPDFRVTELDDSYSWHEFKGNYESEQWKRNIRLWRCGYGPFPGAKLTVWKKSRHGVYVYKVIISKEIGGN